MAEISEQDIRKLTEEAIRQLGSVASAEDVESVVKAAVGRISETSRPAPAVQSVHSSRAGNRIIITAFGKNRVGILAGLTQVLAEHSCDILDLTQKLLQEFFTIMLLVDISGCDSGFEGIKSAIISKGEALDLKVIVQHEEIFNTMHRV